MKLLIDMNLSPLWVQFLSDSGFEGIHWSTIGEPSVPDGFIPPLPEYAVKHR